ncbi:MAG: FtsX-like permease family protein [Phycisphaerales bacterium]|nr:FtsX-like permease family protein [Phycisphaerales bacterium]
MVRALDRKLIRDLRGSWAQALAISVVLACGVAMYIMSMTTLVSVERSMESYYRDQRFADVFAHLKRAPEPLRERIVSIPGVARVETRVVADVNLLIDTRPEPAVGRLVSLPERGEPALNAPYLRRGRWIEPDRPGEALVSEAFAEAHSLRPGDSVRAVINQRLRELTIVGIALSPEYVYEIRPGEMLPDPLRFGVFWMSRRELGPAYDLDGAFNDVSLGLMPGAAKAEVIARLDELLAPYGGLGAYGRDEQISHQVLESEIDQLRGMSLLIPAIFLAVTAFLFNMVISRMIRSQREQIAALKAFGYSNAEIGGHYAGFVGLIVFAGVLLGAIGGWWLGGAMVDMYVRFFRFPRLDLVFDVGAVVVAALLSLLAAGAGASWALRRAVRLPPAEAMRPEPPPDFRATVIERLGLQRSLSQPARMVLRNIERQPLRSSLTCLGMSLAVAIMVLGNLNAEIIDRLIKHEFFWTQRQDMTVSFVEPTSGRSLREVERLPGVLYAEPFRAVAVRVRSGQVSRRVALMGLPEQRDLRRLLDEDAREVALPPDGLLISESLAEILGVRPGQSVQVEVMEGRRPVRAVPIAGVIADYSGQSVYMNINALHRLMREQDAISGAFLKVDPDGADALFSELRLTPGVAGVTIKAAAIDSFEETIAESLLLLRAFTISFATIIAFGVIYNSARISLSERGRELATLRVIGFTRAEISRILLGELGLLTLIAIPLGLVIGRELGAFAMEALQTEHQRFPVFIGRQTYAYAIAVTIVAATLSGLIVRRRLDRLDLIAVLKSQA